MSPADYAYFCELKRGRDLRLLRKVTGYRVVFNPRKSWWDVRELDGISSCSDKVDFSIYVAFRGIFPTSKTIGIDIFCDPSVAKITKSSVRNFTRNQILHEYCHVLAATREEKTQPNLGLVYSDTTGDQELAAIILTRMITGLGSAPTDRPDLVEAESLSEISSRIDPVRHLIPLLQESYESRKNRRP